MGIGILSLAQICHRFDIIAHHQESSTAFRATIVFPPYTRAEMDRLSKNASTSGPDAVVQGGQFQIADEQYNAAKRGIRVYTKYLREPFRKRMRALTNFGNRKTSDRAEPYGSFTAYLDTVYSTKKKVQSLNLLSDYDQLLFGLALASPLPYLEDRNVAVHLQLLRKRQNGLSKLDFAVQVDNLSLVHPLCLPSDRDGHVAQQCNLEGSQDKDFELIDGPVSERLVVKQHTLAIDGIEERFHLYELKYSNKDVAGGPLSFTGYLFQQTGRLYPRDIQGVLVRLQNVAIGRYDNSMLTYPYAEGPRYSMVSGEIFVEKGFEDALNIDRDSFNELHPHYMRCQAYVHSLLHELIFPETWTEEKDRNKRRRTRDAEKQEARFIEQYQKATGDVTHVIHRTRSEQPRQTPEVQKESPVDFGKQGEKLEVDWSHPLLLRALRRRKFAPLIEKVVIAFERANLEPTAAKRRQLFYRLITEIFADL